MKHVEQLQYKIKDKNNTVITFYLKIDEDGRPMFKGYLYEHFILFYNLQQRHRLLDELLTSYEYKNTRDLYKDKYNIIDSIKSFFRSL